MVSIESDFADVSEAARLLGVSTRQVARLAETGQILAPFRGLVDRGSIEHYLVERGRIRRGRAWDERTAWAAVALLSGLDESWLGQAQTSRLKSRLRQLAGRDLDGAQDLVAQTRGRAKVHTFATYAFITPRVKTEVVVVGRRGLGLGGASAIELDGYIRSDDLPKVVRRNELRSDSRGQLTLRATGYPLEQVDRIARRGNGALAALDAASSPDPRERGVGLRALVGYLEESSRG